MFKNVYAPVSHFFLQSQASHLYNLKYLRRLTTRRILHHSYARGLILIRHKQGRLNLKKKSLQRTSL